MPPVPQRDFVVEGRSMRLRGVAGAGACQPTVVFESGLGHGGEMWEALIEEIGPEIAAVAYDRTGLGASVPGPRRDTRSVVAALRALLNAAGMAPPYLLVGHSLGGLYVRAFAYLHPEEVMGLVLVDPSHEQMRQRARELYPVRAGALAQVLVHAAEVAAEHAARLSRRPDRAVAAEGRGRAEAGNTVHALRSARGPISIPLIVLSATKLPPGAEKHGAVLEIMRELHEDITASSTQGQQRFVPVDHAFINADEGRGAVVQAIRDITCVAALA